jgi:hypothetical protein
MGHYCHLCRSFGTLSDGSFSKHLSKCRKGRSDKDKSSQSSGVGLLQRFTLHGIGRSWFCVYPALKNCDPQGRFADFFRNLHSEAKEGGTLYKALSVPDQSSSDKLDVSPFLSKVKWLDATASYSLFKMHKAVALPVEDDLYVPIKGLGEQLLSSLSSLNGVHHNILSGLLAWRNSGYVCFISD